MEGEGEQRLLHGVGSVIHPASFLGPTRSCTAAWSLSQLITRDVSPASSEPEMVDTEDALSECWRAGLCTFFAVGEVALTQYMYACDTCQREVCEARRAEETKEAVSAGCEVAVLVCLACATLCDCHRGHILIPLGRCRFVVCDCGRGQVSLLQPHQRRMSRWALNALPQSESHGPSVASSSSPLHSTPLPPLPLRLASGDFLAECAVQRRRRCKKDVLFLKWFGWSYSCCTWSDRQQQQSRSTAHQSQTSDVPSLGCPAVAVPM